MRVALSRVMLDRQILLVIAILFQPSVEPISKRDLRRFKKLSFVHTDGSGLHLLTDFFLCLPCEGLPLLLAASGVCADCNLTFPIGISEVFQQSIRKREQQYVILSGSAIGDHEPPEAGYVPNTFRVAPYRRLLSSAAPCYACEP